MKKPKKKIIKENFKVGPKGLNYDTKIEQTEVIGGFVLTIKYPFTKENSKGNPGE